MTENHEEHIQNIEKLLIVIGIMTFLILIKSCGL